MNYHLVWYGNGASIGSEEILDEDMAHQVVFMLNRMHENNSYGLLPEKIPNPGPS